MLASEELVWSALHNPETSALKSREKVMLHFVARITNELPGIGDADVQAVRDAGWTTKRSRR